ncbi:hypothetical protein [Pedosphaera parvula]|uniref:Zinc-ribbon domain-containing protein n=1 Tax=Pedosphaera parvula (strain Ellin514) TaxID=320771 RepID=B9XNP5_PEDPL|nr:hypothetical protein [Pedosphaera parvula]EEF58585.1 hypothetical protein Cflav_PD1775 [Pedosphaera parvula Ellin514]
MITKYKQQANQSFVYMTVCFVIGLVCVATACLSNPPIFLSVTLAIVTVLAFSFAVVFYFRGCSFWAEAKGYTSVVFLAAIFGLVGVAILLALLPDESNPARLAEEESYTGPRCVDCNSRIAPGMRICPKCGWTQPAQDLGKPITA